MAGLDSTHIGLTWLQFAVGIVLFIMYFYLIYDALGDWYFSDLDNEGTELAEIAILLLPLGWILFQSAMNRLLVFQPLYPKEVTYAFAIGCLIASVTIGFVYFFKWHGVAIITMDEDIEVPVQIVMSLAIFIICMGYFVVLVAVLFRMCMFTQFAHSVGYSELSDTDAETRGLLELQSGGGQSTGTDNTTAVSINTDKTNNNNNNNNNNNGGSASSSSNILTLQKSKEEAVWDLYDRIKEYTFNILFFVIILPGLIFLNGVFPSDWHKFFPVYIETYNETASTSGWVNNIAFTFRGDTYYMKIFGDLVVYMLFISGVSVVSWLSMKFVTIRLLLRQRIAVEPLKMSFTIGQLIFWILWGILMFIEIYYWLGVHLYEAEDKGNTEVWARFSGVLALIFLSFMFFTVTRIRLWVDCFGMSSDHLVDLHRIFAYCMLICSYAHMIFWIIYFAGSEEYPLDENFIFVYTDLPFSYSDDNWTTAVTQAMMIFFVPIAYGVFASSYVRRKFWELFYIVHVYSAGVFTIVILWHASQGWRYLLPCLILYFIDRCLRLYSGTNFVRVDNLTTYRMGTGNTAEEITRIGISVPKFGSGPDGTTRAIFSNLRYKMGQYCFINIPSISPAEWHPFTISSSQYDSQTTFHIKTMNDEQFSAQVATLENSFGNDSDKKPLNQLEFHIDGPYGIPFNYEGYDRVILVAGGIGVTPCHSMFATMVSIARSQLNNNESITLPYVHILWMVRNPEMLDMFDNTWKAAQRLNGESGRENDLFSVHFYHTRPSPVDRNKGEILRNGLRYQPGRPAMADAIRFIEDRERENTLVFCCGPEGLANDCQYYATKYGAHYYGESFDFSKANDIQLASITFVVFGISIVIMAAICDMY